MDSSYALCGYGVTRWLVKEAEMVVLNAFIMFFSLVFFASVLTAGGV